MHGEENATAAGGLPKASALTGGFKASMLMEPLIYSSVSTRRNPDFDEGCRLCRHQKKRQ